jgi:hypothetical protein
MYNRDGRDGVDGRAICCGLDGPGFERRWEARFSGPILTILEAHPASRTTGTMSLPRVKRPERDVGHSPLSSAEVGYGGVVGLSAARECLLGMLRDKTVRASYSIALLSTACILQYSSTVHSVHLTV